MGAIYVIGTCDTKGEELRFVRDLLAEAGRKVLLVDISTGGFGGDIVDVRATDVAAFHPEGADAILSQCDRGKAITAMSEALVRYLAPRDDIDAAFALGGSGGTALVSPALRSLPIGVPKILVSTVASGNVAPYIGASDICLLYSITDMTGLNRISRTILANAAGALLGMTQHAKTQEETGRATIGLTMFGVTTPCVQQITAALADDFDTLVFHATGTGGQSFEKLVDSGLVSAGIDITTTEVADMLVGGVFPGTEDRFGAFIRTGAPWIGSCGALDMVNFGAMDAVPPRFRNRRLHVHNPQVTLMRTTPEECDRIGSWIGERLNLCEGEVRLLIPEGGISAIAGPGQPFHDPEADAALCNALQRAIRPTAKRQLQRLPFHINSPEFANAVLDAFRDAVLSNPQLMVH